MTSTRSQAAAKRAAQIMRLSRKGLSIAAISAEVGCQRATVNRARAKAGFKADRTGPRVASDEQIRACVARGLIDKIGAAELGMSTYHYAKRRRGLGLAANGQPGQRPAVSDDVIRGCHRRGLTDAEAAAEIGYSAAGFAWRRRRLGLVPHTARRAASKASTDAVKVVPATVPHADSGKVPSAPDETVKQLVRSAFGPNTHSAAVMRLLEPLVARAMARSA